MVLAINNDILLYVIDHDSVVSLPASLLFGRLAGPFALFFPESMDCKEIVMLGDAKHDTINKLLLKALNDNAMSAHEFGIIITEFEWYTFLKNQVQAKLIRQPSNGDVEQPKKDVRCAVEEFRKIITALSGSN